MDTPMLEAPHHRHAIALALVLTAPALLAGSAASADQAHEPERFAAYSPATPGTSCVPDEALGTVDAIAWAEIERLGDAGLPVCDVDWQLVPDRDEWWWWGWAAPSRGEGDLPTVWIVHDVAAYAEDGEDHVDVDLLEQRVRTTVRHELGHALTYMLGLDEISLERLFVADLEVTHPGTRPWHEASAEALALALTPDDEQRTVFYDEDVPARNLAVAELVLDAVTTTHNP